MPKDGINSDKLRERRHPLLKSIRKPCACSIISNDYDIISQIKFNYSDQDNSFESPPLPPRPNTYVN